MMATVVEIFWKKVFRRMPPVPQTSRISCVLRQAGSSGGVDGFFAQGAGEGGDFLDGFALQSEVTEELVFNATPERGRRMICSVGEMHLPCRRGMRGGEVGDEMVQCHVSETILTLFYFVESVLP